MQYTELSMLFIPFWRPDFYVQLRSSCWQRHYRSRLWKVSDDVAERPLWPGHYRSRLWRQCRLPGMSQTTLRRRHCSQDIVIQALPPMSFAWKVSDDVTETPLWPVHSRSRLWRQCRLPGKSQTTLRRRHCSECFIDPGFGGSVVCLACLRRRYRDAAAASASSIQALTSVSFAWQVSDDVTNTPL